MKKFFISLSLIFFCVGFFVLFLDFFEKNSLEEDLQHERVHLVLGGDIMISRGIGWWAKKYGYGRVFSGDNYNPLTQFDCYMSGDCLLFFNLESMFSKKDNDIPESTFLFRSNVKNLQFLSDLKKDNELILSLANNHTSNAGGAGMRLTRDILSGAGIGFAGAGVTDEEAQEMLQIEKNGFHICFQAFSYDGTSGKYGEEYLSWNPMNQNLMEKTLDQMNDSGCDVKILGLHWGAEYYLKPFQWQRDLAYHLIDYGADIILGGHSHVPGSHEIYKDKPIFYSFGNFLFDQDWGKNSKGGGYDYIYDYGLNKSTVPTYIPLMAGLDIVKTNTGILIENPDFKMARINKGLYDPIDDETFQGVMESLAF